MSGEAECARGAWAGTRDILAFNWPYHVAGVATIAAGTVLLACLPMHTVARVALTVALVASAWLVVASLVVTHLVYDRSDLYRFGWLARVLGPRCRRVIACSAGFDDTSIALRRRFARAEWRALDHFAPSVTTEPSIRRARRARPPAPTAEPAPHDAWPVADGWADAILAILAIHELRRESERVAWFTEARRCLGEDGRVVLVEHVRDLANALAFGPGSLHFHSAATWRRGWTQAGLRCVAASRVTPFVRVFVLERV